MQSPIANRKSTIALGMMGVMGIMGFLMTRCASTGDNGRVGTVEASAEVDAKVDAAVQAALVQWKSEIVNTIDATLTARIGDNVGRDKNTTKTTTDSLTSIILAGGLVGIILVGLALYYRSKMTGAEQVSRRLIGQIESRRDRTPCHCGKCADCIVESLRRDDTSGLNTRLHKLVKATTG